MADRPDLVIIDEAAEVPERVWGAGGPIGSTGLECPGARGISAEDVAAARQDRQRLERDPVEWMRANNITPMRRGRFTEKRVETVYECDCGEQQFYLHTGGGIQCTACDRFIEHLRHFDPDNRTPPGAA